MGSWWERWSRVELSQWIGEEGAWGDVPLATPQKRQDSHPVLSNTFCSGSFKTTSLLPSRRADSWPWKARRLAASDLAGVSPFWSRA